METRILVAYCLIAVMVAALVGSAIWLRRNTAEAKRLQEHRRDRASRVRNGTSAK